MTLVTYAVVDRVAVLTIDNPPVNALGPGVWEAIDEAVARAGADPEADAMVLTGAGRTFVAGADIHIFSRLKTREDALARTAETHALLRRIEDAAKPLVAAIHGQALGGGLELAMACHFRVAAPDAIVGQPEVTLGIIPGAGGSQRLPRLCGVPFAVRLCAGGRPIAATEALRAGLVDHLVEGGAPCLRDAAVAFARAKAREALRRRTRDLAMPPDAAAGVAACEAMRAGLASTARGLRAPVAAVDAIEAGLTRSFDEGSRRERELFADCVVSTESRALRHLFFAERDAARIAGLPRETPAADVRTAAVVGAGTMGSGIALTYALAGIPVRLTDVSQAALDGGLAAIERALASALAKGRLTQAARDAARARVTPSLTFEGFDGVDVVVEAVFEDAAAKRETFAALGAATRADCVLASNTSTLDIDALAEASGRPSQVVGHHFFSPAHVMRLLEVVRGRETSPRVLATSIQLGKRLGKIPVVVGNAFGFVANRMLAPYLREAGLLLEEGATVAEIDGAVEAFGLPMGPFAMQDVAGIDVGARIRQHLAASGRTWAEGPQSAIPDRLFEMGRYGQKSGAGWYRYDAGTRERLADPLIEALAAEDAARRGLVRATGVSAPSADAIVARLMTALANEGAQVLHEGLAQRPGDVDVIYCHGFGFPRHRGGPLFYAQTVGLETVLDRVRQYRARFGEYWRPAPLLEALVAEGRGFYPD